MYILKKMINDFKEDLSNSFCFNGVKSYSNGWKKVHNLRTRIYNMNEKFDNMEGKYSKKVSKFWKQKQTEILEIIY